MAHRRLARYSIWPLVVLSTAGLVGVALAAGAERYWVAAAIGAATIAGLVVALRRLARTLESIRAGAERFARGELDYKLPLPPLVEAARLADALNRMAAQLQERIGIIQRQSNEQQAVLGSMVEGVLAVDRQHHVISLNAACARLLSIDAKTAVGRLLDEAVRNADLRRFVVAALDGAGPATTDVVLRGPLDETLQARRAVLHDAAGRTIGVLVVLNDVTQFRRLEQIRRDFVANVSHELKTPITAIKGFVETLLDGAREDPAESERFLRIVARQADRLHAIIEDLLSLSKIEQGEEAGSIAMAAGSVYDVLLGAVAACQALAAERQIDVRLDCDEQLAAAINAPLLEQAVVNLLDNAIKYSEPARSVQVSAAPVGNEVIVRVADHGCGIPAEHLPRIFERFYRVDKARSRKLGGTGLGLAIVKHIVAAHGGRVVVTSTPGQGTTFAIHLPAGPEK